MDCTYKPNELKRAVYITYLLTSVQFTFVPLYTLLGT